MSIEDEIHAGFKTTKPPFELVANEFKGNCEGEEALHFDGMKWTDVTPKHWRKNSDAFYALSPEAFRYYLPSLLLAALDEPKKQLLAVDALLMVLDRSPVPEYWDEFLVNRFTGLDPRHYEIIQKWLIEMMEHSNKGEANRFTRAFDTIEQFKSQ